MFWRRTTGHAAFLGLLSGILAAALHHGLTQPHGAISLAKGGWLGRVLHVYPSEMAQNFWTAIFAWTACFVVTIVISLLTRQQKTDAELTGLVHSLTPRTTEHDVVWYKRPAALAVVVLVMALILNIIFW
jgi:SSS family solute:Na+ symporter